MEDRNLMKFIFGALSPDGILAVAVGEAPSIEDAYSTSSKKYDLVQGLLEVGFHSVKDYEEVGIFCLLAVLFTRFDGSDLRFVI
jgi:hypothetical protein